MPRLFCAGESLVGGLAIPGNGLRVVLGRVLAAPEESREGELGFDVAAIGQLADPFDDLAIAQDGLARPGQGQALARSLHGQLDAGARLAVLDRGHCFGDGRHFPAVDLQQEVSGLQPEPVPAATGDDERDPGLRRRHLVLVLGHCASLVASKDDDERALDVFGLPGQDRRGAGHLAGAQAGRLGDAAAVEAGDVHRHPLRDVVSEAQPGDFAVGVKRGSLEPLEDVVKEDAVGILVRLERPLASGATEQRGDRVRELEGGATVDPAADRRVVAAGIDQHQFRTAALVEIAKELAERQQRGVLGRIGVGRAEVAVAIAAELEPVTRQPDQEGVDALAPVDGGLEPSPDIGQRGPALGIFHGLVVGEQLDIVPGLPEKGRNAVTSLTEYRRDLNFW